MPYDPFGVRMYGQRKDGPPPATGGFGPAASSVWGGMGSGAAGTPGTNAAGRATGGSLQVGGPSTPLGPQPDTTGGPFDVAATTTPDAPTAPTTFRPTSGSPPTQPTFPGGGGGSIPPVQTGPGSSFDQSRAVVPGGGNAYNNSQWGQNGQPDWTPGTTNYGAPDNAPVGFGGTPLTQSQRNAMVSKPAEYTIATNDPDVWLSAGGAVWQTPGKTWGNAGMNNSQVFGTNPANGDSYYNLPSGRYHANRTTGILEPVR